MNIKKVKGVHECGCIDEVLIFYENENKKLKLGIYTHTPKCKKNHFLPPHRKKNLDIYFPSSNALLQIENKEIWIPEKMYTIINPGQISGGKDKKKITVPKQELELVIHPSIFENVLEELNLKKPNCGIEFDIHPQRKSELLDRILKVLILSCKDSDEFGSTLLVEQSVLQLVTVLLKEHPNSVKELLKKQSEFIKYDTRIQKAIEYLKDNYNKKFSLDGLAKEVCISKWRLLQLFKQNIGKTPVQYLNEYRIEKVKYLLKNPNLTIEEISELVGYGDPRYLREVFTKYTKMSISSFRKMISK
jgi:AraC-like DNA-binding protein